MYKALRQIGLAVCVVVFSAAAGAQPGMGDKGRHGGEGGMMPMGHPMGHGMARGGHLFGSHWRETLSDEQRAEIDWMHLRLRQEQQVLKAEIALRKAELNRLVTGEDVSADDLRAKVDELMGLKRDYLLNKYQHKIEMRQVLNPQQRVSFDLDVLSGGHGGGYR